MRSLKVCEKCKYFSLSDNDDVYPECNVQKRPTIPEQFDIVFTKFENRTLPEDCPYKLEHLVINEKKS